MNILGRNLIITCITSQTARYRARAFRRPPSTRLKISTGKVVIVLEIDDANGGGLPLSSSQTSIQLL